jgi:hypothetical protein
LLRKQQQQNRRQKEKSISLEINSTLPIFLKQQRRFDEKEHQKWPKKEPQSQGQ